MKTVTWLLSLLLILGGTSVVRAEEVRTYIVQPGDSAWSIAEAFYGSGQKYPIIYKYNNHAGPAPFLLSPGQVLRLPVLNVLPEAQVRWLQRDVRAKPPRSLDWLKAREDMNLWRLYRVSTGEASAAHIVFEDKSDLRLKENALLVITGGAASAARTGRRDKIEVSLEEGTIQGGLAALDAQSQGGGLKIATPSAAVEILGALTQVEAHEQVSVVSAFTGPAAVSAQGARVDVPEGHGSVVKKGSKPAPARPLPPSPAWAPEVRDALVIMLRGERGQWEAAWQPVADAASYRVELSADEAFTEVLYDAEVGAGVTRLRLVDLNPGHYAVRVSARTADGLESKPGQARLLDALEVTTNRTFASNEGIIEATGFLKLSLPSDAPEGAFIAQAEAPDTPIDDHGVLRLAAPGLHDLRVRAGSRETPLRVRILGVQALVTVGDEAQAPNRDASGARSAQASELSWSINNATTMNISVKNELDAPVSLPDVSLVTEDGAVFPAEALSVGRYRVLLPPQDRREWGVAVRWAGGTLAQTRLVDSHHAPEAPKAHRAALPITPAASGRGMPLGFVQARPETRLAWDGRYLQHAAADTLGFELKGEIAIQRWGLGASVGYQNLTLGASSTEDQSRLGDVVLGARYAVLDGPDVVLSPSVRVALPAGTSAPRLFTIEPALLLRAEVADALWLDLQVAFAYADDFDAAHRSTLDALAALTWRFATTWSLNASFEAGIGLDRSALSPRVGLGVTSYLGPVRLGLGAGVALSDDAKHEFGSFFGRVVLDFGWPVP